MTANLTEPEPPVVDAQRDFQAKEVEGLSQGRIVWRRFLRHRAAMIASVILLFVVVLSVTSIGWGPIPGWWKWNYVDTGLDPLNFQGNPTLVLPWISGEGFKFAWGSFPFGLDPIGRDNFARNMRGIQQSLTVIVLVGILSTTIGVVLGALAGYYRGWVESVIMRFTDLVLTLPAILITAVMGFDLGLQGVLMVSIALGLLSWPGLCRLVRGEFLLLREREFVDAAKVAGASSRRIIFKHILPNTVGVILVSVTLTMSAAILLEAALSFLGFGIEDPDVSLGSLISLNVSAMEANQPWLFLWPGVFIVIIVLTLNFIGDGLRDAFDPRQRRVPKVRDLKRGQSDAVEDPVLLAAETGTIDPIGEEIEPQ